MSLQFLNDPSDVQWLLDTHLKGVPSIPPFKSFLLKGNEDAPESLKLFESDDPLESDKYTLVEFKDAPFYCEVTPK